MESRGLWDKYGTDEGICQARQKENPYNKKEEQKRIMKDFAEYIIYEEKHLIICHKPSGVPVQSAGVGVLDLECACLNYLQQKNKKNNRQPYVGIVQRLDQPVEGLVVLAKTKQAAGELGRQVQDGRMEKTYLAVVDGEIEDSQGELCDWLLKDSKMRMAKVVPPGTKGSKEAKLCYRVLQRREGKSLLEIRLLTGRYHQIRAQLSHFGFPLAGDTKYNPQGHSQTGGLGLCACRLYLSHPVSGEKMGWEIWPDGEVFRNWQV